MEEPLPCPFCGAIPDVRQDIRVGKFWIVVCANFGDSRKPSEESGCVIMPTTAWCPDKSMAIALWNKRPTAMKDTHE